MPLRGLSASPISKLHDDTLWSIFLLNSYPNGYIESGGFKEARTPLVINRRTSQVCQRWRSIMVHSPSIWANAIELRCLNQRVDNWRDEVLIRTGNALLTVIGRVDDEGHNSFVLPFCLRLLDAHWNRIQTLIIHFNNADIYEKLCQVFSSPAPNIKQLDVTQGYGIEHKTIPFLNHAPQLHTLSTSRLSFSFSEAFWSSSICHLTFEWSREDISILELLHSLESMASLQTLKIRDKNPDIGIDLIVRQTNDADAIRTFNLRGLRSFTIYENNTMVPEILPYIIIPPHCTFAIDSGFFDFNVEFPQPVARCFATFFEKNFTLSTVTHVTYLLRCNETEGMEPMDPFNAGEPDDTYGLNISFGHSTEKGSQCSSFRYDSALIGINGLPFRMAEALSCCKFSMVTTLSLSLSVHFAESILEHPLWEQMYTFFYNLESVETLHTDEQTLKFYMDSEDLCATNVLFPRLETVYTNYWDTGLVQFLNYRHQNCKNEEPDHWSGCKRIKRVVLPLSAAPYHTFSVAQLLSTVGLSVEWQGRND